MTIGDIWPMEKKQYATLETLSLGQQEIQQLILILGPGTQGLKLALLWGLVMVISVNIFIYRYR
jgi:hypothetical protein